MKRLMLTLATISLVGLLLVSPIGSAQSLDQLMDMAATDALPEVRRAASIALVPQLTTSTMTDDELRRLASRGRSTELRDAAGQALGKRLVSVDLTIDELRALAADSAYPGVRAAAGNVLAERLLNANLSLNQLNGIATGSTPELRASAHDALVQALVAAVGRRTTTLEELSASVATAKTDELARAHAEAVLVLLRPQLVAPENQSPLENLVNGATVTINSVALDGSLTAFRVEASQFLTGIYTFFGFLDRFQEPLSELEDLARDASRTEEFRAAARRALVPVYSAQRDEATQALDRLATLLDQIETDVSQGAWSLAGQSLTAFRERLDANRTLLVTTAEVGGELSAQQMVNNDLNRRVAALASALDARGLATVRTTISQISRLLDSVRAGVQNAPNVSTDQLQVIAIHGETSEIRAAAAEVWGDRIIETDLTQSELIGMIIAHSQAFPSLADSSSPELSDALALALASRFIAEP